METCDDEYALTTLRQSKTSQADDPMRPRVSQLLELVNDIRDGGFLRLVFIEVPHQKPRHVFEENPGNSSVSHQAKNM